MLSVAMQIPGVSDINFDHEELCAVSSLLSCRAKSRHLSNDEALMTNDEGMTKLECRKFPLLASSFRFHSSFRHSDFVISIVVSLILSACFANSSRNTHVRSTSCRMIISVSCFLWSSFCHPSFHQQKPITPGHRFENRSSSAAFAQSAALTRRLCRSQPNSAMMIGFPGAIFARRG